MNLSGEYSVFDEGDTTTQLLSGNYYHLLYGTTFSSHTIQNVIKLDIITREGGVSKGRYLKSIVDFQLNPDDFALDPSVGDYIIDAENLTYYVISTRRPVFHDYWGVSCICPHLAHSTVLTWKNAIEYTDVYGGRTISYSTVGAYSGWVQATGNSVEDMFGKRGFVEDFIIWPVINLDIRYGDLIEADGVIYEIYDINNSKRLDELQLLKGVVKP